MELLIQFLKRCRLFFKITFQQLEPIEVANILMNGGKIVLLKRTSDDLIPIYEIFVEFCGRKFDVAHADNVKYYINRQLLENPDSDSHDIRHRCNEIEYINYRIINEDIAKLVCLKTAEYYSNLYAAKQNDNSIIATYKIIEEIA